MPDFRVLGQQLSNWGRWGPEDERGTVNFITGAQVVRGARSVERGKVFDLSIPIDRDTPQPGNLRVPPVRLMSETGADQEFRGGFHVADDYVFMALQCATQLDALCHVFYDDHLYNGFPADSLSSHGAKRNSIDKLDGGVIGTGVLLDAARYFDVPWLERGHSIMPEDLDKICERQGVVIQSGDIILLRTGWWHRYVEEGNTPEVMRGEPGLDLSCAEWIAQHEIAAVAADNYAIEAIPPIDRSAMLALHMVLIRDLGVTLGEMFNLEELAADCAADGRYEFFFCAPRLKFTGAAGTPVTPIAIK